MNLRVIFSVLLAWNLITLSAQSEMVYPNRPKVMMKTNQGPIATLEYNSGYGVSNDTLYKDFKGFTALMGYQVNRSFIIAAGSGVSFYSKETLVPVFGDIRYTFYISKIAPYLFADGGLLMDVSDLDKTLVFMNGGIGARYSLSRKFALNLSTGLLLQAGGSGQVMFWNVKTGGSFKF